MRKHNGFTIVELLIVIVIIGVLAMISIVAYNGISEKARRAATQQNTSQIEREIMVHAVQNGVSIHINNMVGYIEQPGVAKLSTPITGTSDITMYVVYNVRSITGDYLAVANLTPESATNRFRFQTSASGVTGMHQRIDTPIQTNMTLYSPNVRNIGRTIIGWSQVNNNATERSMGFNTAAPNSSSTLASGANWSFTGLIASDNSGGTTQAMLVFNGAHDETTRAQVISWLAEKYNVAL